MKLIVVHLSKPALSLTEPLLQFTAPNSHSFPKSGRTCSLSSDCLYWSWDSYRLNCDLKENDGDGAIIAWDYYSGEKGCPPNEK